MRHQTTGDPDFDAPFRGGRLNKKTLDLDTHTIKTVMDMVADSSLQQDWQRADARVLGQILAAQNIIFALPDTARIAEFYAQLLISIPGITACRVCLGNRSVQAGEMQSDVCSECETLRHRTGEDDAPIAPNSNFGCSLGDQPDVRSISIHFYQHHFGFIVFKINDAADSDIYHPFINNLSHYVAITLENRLQKDLLQKAHDELERKVEERTSELTEVNERFSLAARAARLGVWDWDIQNNELVWDDQMFELYGVNRQDFPRTYETCLKQVHPEDRARSDELWRLALDGQRGYEAEFRIVWPDGNVRYLKAYGKTVTDTCGRPSRMTGISYDITEEKQAEEALRESEAKFMDLYENAPCAYFSVGKDSAIRLCNHHAEGLLGYSRTELIGKPVFELYADTPKGKEKAGKVFEGFLAGEPIADEELQMRRADGSPVWISLTVNGIRDSGGQLIESRSMVLDISGRKRAEEALRNVDSQKQAILDGIPAWLAFVNENLEIQWANQAAADLSGKALSQMVGHKCHEFRAYPDRPCDGCPTVKAFNTKKAERTIMVTSDGRVWDVKGQPVFDDGKLLGVVEIALDITELTQAQVQLEKERSQLRALVQTIPDLVWLKDPDGVYLTCNPRFERFFGAEESDIVGKTDYDFVDADLADFFRDHDRKAMEAEKPSVNEEWITFADDGHRELLETIKTPMYDSDGVLIGVLGIGRNITAARQAEEAQKRLATAIEQAAEAVVITDAEGIIQYVNPAFETVTGYTPREAVGSNPRILKSGEHDAAFYQDMWDTIKGGGIWSGRITNRNKKGQLYHEETSISPVRDASGQIVNFVAVKRNITEHLELSRQLFQAQKMEAVGTLAGGVAHDFNNILQVVLGYSELLLCEEQLPKKFREDLAKINTAARNGAELVKQLLTFSRKTEIKPLHLNLNGRIEQLQKMLSRTISKMIEMELSLADDLWSVNADPTQIDQVIMNLAVNARDAMPEGGKLVIETKNVTLDEEYSRSHLDAKPGPYVLLAVSDTGYGMDKETALHIFEPFFTTKGPGEGTGLGLATVYGIVKHHDGYITCYSEPGSGTTFKLYFPAVVSDDHPIEAAPKALPRGGSETVLLVDDEEFIRDLGSRILTRAGYRVVLASNGKEALEMFQRRADEIALVILDLIMPEMDGRQCLEALLQIDPAIKIVIASGYSANGPTKKAVSEGAKGFINKPYDIRQVLEVVRNVLDQE